MHSKLSHSSTGISDKPTPTTEGDFDKLLEDLAKFKVETRLVIGCVCVCVCVRAASGLGLFSIHHLLCN